MADPNAKGKIKILEKMSVSFSKSNISLKALTIEEKGLIGL